MWSYAARGVVAAIAMSLTRAVTTRLGLLREAPPEAIARQTPAPRWAESRPATELAHYGYGAAAGAAFGALPGHLRHARFAGPAYGVATWMFFEAVLAPALGLRQARERRLIERLVLAGDHVMYGLIVAHPKRVLER